MPKQDEGHIFMGDLGHLKEFNTPGFPANPFGKDGLFEMVFDTGVRVYAPELIAKVMKFSLEQSDG